MIVTVLEPASEYGQKGMDELHEQTVNLLSFQNLPKNVFDVQVAFNMVPALRSRNRSHSLDKVSARILKHYRRLAPSAIEPSLLTIQAPVFHGHTLSIYVETEKPIAIKDFSKALAGEHVVITAADDTPNNVSAAGQGDILLTLKSDANRKNGVWLWAAIDNLRVSALSAVECAESLTASRPRGQIQ